MMQNETPPDLPEEAMTMLPLSPLIKDAINWAMKKGLVVLDDNAELVLNPDAKAPEDEAGAQWSRHGEGILKAAKCIREANTTPRTPFTHLKLTIAP